MNLRNITISATLLSLYTLSSFANKTPDPVCLHYGGKLELRPLVYSCRVPCAKPAPHPESYVLYQDGAPIAVVPRPNPDPHAP